MMYYNIYTNPVYLVLMTTANTVYTKNILIHPYIYISMLMPNQLAIQVIWLLLSTVRCNLQQTVRSLQSIRTFRILLPGFIDLSLNLSSQSVSSKTAIQILISSNSRNNNVPDIQGCDMMLCHWMRVPGDILILKMTALHSSPVLKI